MHYGTCSATTAGGARRRRPGTLLPARPVRVQGLSKVQNIGWSMPIRHAFMTSTSLCGSDALEKGRLDTTNAECEVGNDSGADTVADMDSGDNTDDNHRDGDDETPFPRIGWTPGSFGARALRPSRKRKPGEPTGRTKPPRTENDYWHEAGVYNTSSSTDEPSK